MIEESGGGPAVWRPGFVGGSLRRARRSAHLAATVSAVVAVLAAGVAAAQASAGVTSGQSTLAGRVLTVNRPLASIRVALYRAARDGSMPGVLLGRSVTRADGSFAIGYRSRRASGSVDYVTAGPGATVRLAASLGAAPLPTRVLINERTTVAMGFALAQFIAGREVGGPAPGPQNAAAIAADLADVRTGALAAVLQTAPNGTRTSTLRTFDSLSNMIVPCARSLRGCSALFRLATPPGGAAPRDVLTAVADIARNPAHNARGLFGLSRAGGAPYRPALRATQRPDAWMLALRFAGDGETMDGPGNMAIDARGDVWVTGNYTYSANPLADVCGSKLLFEFTPAGRYVAGSPYSGGGLDGAGFGITLDPHGNVWVGNFGFSSTGCQTPPAHAGVSEFSSAGAPLSPAQTDTSPGGFTAGGVSWPQGTVSDRLGDIWVANCGNNTVTRYAQGDPDAALSIGGLGIEKPFDIAFNGRGQAFVTGDGNSMVAIIDPDGQPAPGSPVSQAGLDKPLGIAADSQGNMWIANSGFVDVPCPDLNLPPNPTVGSLTLLRRTGAPAPGSPFTGGGLTTPWGVAVDGNDNVWVANFSGQRVSEFCGTHPAHCPPGTRTGQPLSPSRGYGFDGLVRNTGIQIDPSGNVWVANNWKTIPNPAKNPGGYQLVAFIGMAKPIRTPLIGPPRAL